MTLLEILQQVCDELGFDRPAGVVANQSPEIRQMFSLLRRFSQDLVRKDDWQRLTREAIVETVAVQRVAAAAAGDTTLTLPGGTAGISVGYGVIGTGVRPFSQIVAVDAVAGTVTLNMTTDAIVSGELTFAQIAYPLPEDWKNQIPQTEWDRTNRWPLMGPQTGQAWQSFKSGIVYAGPRLRWRILDQAIVLNPPPGPGFILAYEYISKSHVIAIDGTRKQDFTADTDTSIFDPSLLILGTIIQFKRAKGLDAGFEQGSFLDLLETVKGQDRSAPALSISPRPADILLTNANIPDGNWGNVY